VSRAVVDLRAYAAGTEPARDWLGGRKTPAFADAAAQVAALAPRGEGRVDALGADEFVIVLTGRLDLEVRGEAMAVETGQSAVLPVGSSFGWRASEDTLLVIASAAADTPGTQTAPVLIDETAELTLQPAFGRIAGGADAVMPQSFRLLVGDARVCLRHMGFHALSPPSDALSPYRADASAGG
jgi:mannose-6-phosphate isomerase-like protein (cupin superfamily)